MASPPPIEVSLDSLKSLKGKTIIVTGASSGIGLETADLFYDLGLNVVYVGGRKYPPTTRNGPRALLLQCDITSWDSQVKVFTAAIEKFGKIDIVLPNAGVAEPLGQYFDLEVDEDGKPKPLNYIAYEVDLKGTAATITLALFYMKGNGGSIVVMSSKASYHGVPILPGYSASKHGVLGLLRSLSPGAAARNVSLSLVAPGMTYTPGVFPDFQRGEEAFLQAKQKYQSIGMRISSSRTCALAVGYLVAKGIDSAGWGLMIDDDEIFELEKAVQDSFPPWLVKAFDESNSGDEYTNQQTKPGS